MYICLYLGETYKVWICVHINLQAREAWAVSIDKHMYGYWSDSGLRVGGETGRTHSGHTPAATHH